MERLTRRIWLSKYFLLPAAIVTIILTGIAGYYASISDIVLFPNQTSYNCGYYNDAPNGGNTQIIEHSVSDSLIKFKFQLSEGFHSPYAGLILTPTKHIAIDAKRHNQLSIKIAGRNIDRVGIAIFTPLPYNNAQNIGIEALYHSYLNISDRAQIYRMPLGQFQHPEWWEDLYHIPKDRKNKPDLGQILHVNIGSAFSTIADRQKTMEIYSIAFTRNNSVLFMWLAIANIAFVTILFGVHFFIQKWRSNRSQITVSYKALDVENHTKHDEKCLEYINTNYHDTDLTLDKIAAVTGTMPRRIAQTIHEGFNCNFKTYLNRIRMCESKRLLAQTDLNIGEIAFKVGFNNQSHFNRVFKNELGISPTEFRENSRH
jgi:AraC-like DNA-binding protein